MMPGLDGFGLLRALRADARTRTMPVVLLSARAGEEARVEGLEAGADDYLVKPFSARELLARVRTHLELARVRRGAAEAADHRRWVESILDLMPTPLLLVEPGSAGVSFAFAFANKAADRMAGGELRELLKSAPDELRQRVEVYTHRDGQREPGGEMPWARAARGERLEDVEIELRTESGSCSLLVSSDMLPAMHNHPATAVLVFQDVTRLKRTEAELQRAVEAREAFLTIASHELKTPLTPLQLQISALERRAGDLARDDAAAEWLRARVEMIRRQGRRLDRLVHDLLDVSRITGARVRLDLEPVSLPEVVREAVARLEESGTTARSGSRIDLRLEGEVIGRWDRLRAEQIVTNLLENALKFGLGHPVEVAAFADAEAATLTVTDAGIGIRPEDRERIFGRFERAVPERHRDTTTATGRSAIRSGSAALSASAVCVAAEPSPTPRCSSGSGSPTPAYAPPRRPVCTMTWRNAPCRSNATATGATTTASERVATTCTSVGCSSSGAPAGATRRTGCVSARGR